MATPNSKSKAHRGRNSRASGQEPASPTKATLKAAIEAERRQLQKVDAVLGCIAVAYDTPVCEIDIPDAIEAARSLVGESVNRLDSVNLLRSRRTED